MKTNPKSAATTSRPTVRPQVRDLLTRSPSYRALPAERRKEIAGDTAKVAAYLVDPHGLLSREFRNPLLVGVVASARSKPATGAIRPGRDTLQSGSQAFDELVEAIDFPSFVANLIQGVFAAVLNASIRQMQAYGELVAAVAKSVDDFKRDNIGDDAARDHLAREFPDVLCWTDGARRRLKLHALAGSPGLARLAAAIGLRKPVPDPRRAGETKRLVAAARRRLARNRQQLLATTLMMGINRIVVTDGSIAPKAKREPT